MKFVGKILLKFDENSVSYDKLGRSGSSCGNSVVKVAALILFLLNSKSFLKSRFFGTSQQTEEGSKKVPSAWVNDMQSYYGNRVGRRRKWRVSQVPKSFQECLIQFAEPIFSMACSCCHKQKPLPTRETVYYQYKYKKNMQNIISKFMAYS